MAAFQAAAVCDGGSSCLVPDASSFVPLCWGSFEFFRPKLINFWELICASFLNYPCGIRVCRDISSVFNCLEFDFYKVNL